jgi:type II secretory pathway component HofQ
LRLPRVSLSADNAPIVQVLQQAFEQAGVPYAIDPRVGGRVTYHGTKVPLHRALHQILYRTTPGLHFRVRDGRYVVDLRDLEPGFVWNSVSVGAIW